MWGRNVFDVNRAVAMAHVQTQQMRGYFLGKARMLVILLSGSMLCMGVTMLLGNLHFAPTLTFLFALIAVLPIALVSGLLAVVIEGGTVFASNLVRETNDTVEKELGALQKVKGKLTALEVAQKTKQIKRKRWSAWALLGICIFFSTIGAEVFWQEIMQNASVLFHVLGAVLGLVCSTLLVFFELQEDMIERIVERSISSSALIGLALTQSANSQIYELVFKSQKEYLATQEVGEIVSAAQESRLHLILAQNASSGTQTVTAEQIKRDVRRVKEERDRAETFLATNDENLLLPQNTEPLEKIVIKRKSKTRLATEKLLTRYSNDIGRITNDLDKYATEAKMDPRTLQKNLEAILAEQSA